MTKEDLECYRVNYSKNWFGLSKDCFPIEGAVLAINALCDEVDVLNQRIKELETKNKLFKKSRDH